MNASEKLKEIVHVLEYDPSGRFPKPYLVRIARNGRSFPDMLPLRETHDALGFGDSVEEAARRAFWCMSWLEWLEVA